MLDNGDKNMLNNGDKNMPHLKITDVKEQLDLFESRMTEKFNYINNKILTLINQAEYAKQAEQIDYVKYAKDKDPEDMYDIKQSTVINMKTDINDIRHYLEGHINIYNNHIIQQHNLNKRP